MLGGRDYRAYSSSSDHTFSESDMAHPMLPSPSGSPQPLSGSDVSSFSVFGSKSEHSDNGVPDCGMDVMATRQASLAVETEQEQDASVRRESTPTTKAEISVVKRRNVGVPKFLRFLFQILEVEDPNIIAWSHDGTAFQIIHSENLANQILPRYFKHNKVSSFQRQLNYFGFKKWTKTQTNICTFSHPFFLRMDKGRMKLIKRKERTNSAAMLGSTIQSHASDMSPPLHGHAQMEDHFDAQDLRSQLPTQQALKRQKSNTLSGPTVTFLNSAASGRRHSTGMLPGSEAFGMAAAAAAVAAAQRGQNRAGTPAEQEFELELEARTEAMAQTSSPQQQFWYLHKLAETKTLSQRYFDQCARGKNGFNFGDPLGGNGLTRGSGIGSMNFGRRKSDQLMSELNLNGTKAVLNHQIDDLLATSSPSSHPVFASNVKNDATAVLPVTSSSFYQDATSYPEQTQLQETRQHMNRHGPTYGVKPDISSRYSSSQSTSYQAQAPTPSMMLPYKFNDSNTSPPFQNCVGSHDFSAQLSAPPKVSQRPPMTSHQYQSHPDRMNLFRQQEQPRPQARNESSQTQPARDYIDVLLESAALDENVTLQTSSSLLSESWQVSNYSQTASNSSGPYPSVSHQHSGQQHFQLSPMEGVPYTSTSRF
ncbi:hypothetical protein CCR75_001723 [Bremia lactucae]|uniref:HSF-type DNA-binding domain-containing protein n=1 Tax=Bremia lactucae TaxID=4779 RepID=A0A976FG06_BRELC|nr:hypothetical protein CCR75_001723 [Bremia lactucae]